MIQKWQTKQILEHERILRNSFHKIETKNCDTSEMENFFSDVDIPKLSGNQAEPFEEILTKHDLYNSLKKHAKWQISR